MTPPPSSMSSSISPEPGEYAPSTTSIESPYSARLAAQNGSLVYSSDMGGSGRFFIYIYFQFITIFRFRYLSLSVEECTNQNRLRKGKGRGKGNGEMEG